MPRPSFIVLLFALILCVQNGIAIPRTTIENGQFSPVTPRYPSQAPPTSQKSRNVFPQLTWLRDTAIEKIFRIPPKAQKIVPAQGGHQRSAVTQLPATLLAKYGGDVVLRFNLSSSAEEQALAEAADTLFLDVWEFTSNWADIRLREDDVC